MRRNRILLAVLAVLLLGTVATTGCRRVRLTDERAGGSGATKVPQTVELGAATALDATVRMGVGTLQLRAGEPSSTLALDGRFSYPAASWKPEVDYSVEASRGLLSVVQPEVTGFPKMSIGAEDSRWTLALPQGVPTDLSLKLGVGESTIDLRNIDLTSLDVVTGVGAATIDLSGPRTHDLTGSIDSAVGRTDIVVPSAVGVRLVGGTEGVGELRAVGFTESGGDLVNAAYSQPGPKITLQLHRGVGEMVVREVN